MRKILPLIILILPCFMMSQEGTFAPWMDSFQNTNKATTAPTFQEITDAFNAHWVGKDPTVRGSGYKPFKRWESLYQDFLNPDGTIMTKKQIWDAWSTLNQSRNAQSDDSDWVSVGPLTHTNTGSWSSGQGRLNAFAVDPNNNAIWYAGAPAGGLWVSNDAGSTWQILTDTLPQLGVSGIAIDPNDSNIIYIATGDDDNSDSDAIGILKTIDGGITWDFTGLNLDNTPDRLSEIYIDPTDSQKIWVASSEGVFRTSNGGDSWNNVQPGNFDDIKLKPGDSNFIYAVTESEFYKSENGGDSWEAITNGFPGGWGRLVIDVTPANPDVVYIFATDNSFGSGKIFKSSDNGNSFIETFDGNQNIFEVAQAWYDLSFAVSDTNENEIYTGVLNVWKSINSGANFTQVSSWSAPFSDSYTHADIHRLGFINGRLFCASDGGLYSSTDGGTNFTDHSAGLAIGQFYRISLAKNTSDKIAGGLQDNGGYARSNDVWQNYFGADGMETAIDPNNPDRVFGFIQFGGGLYISNSGGASLDESYGGPENGNWITPLQYSKDNRLYAAYTRIYEFDFCTNSWQAKTQSFGGLIDRLSVDPNDKDVLYIAINNSLYRSEDTGNSFDLLESFTSDITGIEVNHNNSDIIYISTSGTEGKVYEGTLASNALTLNDITGSLPNIPKLVIKHQARHSDNPLFLGTNLGVWRYDSVVNDWTPFQNGLPNVPVRDLEIGLEDGKLTAATFGRGVWQTDIPTQAIVSDIAITALELSESQIISCSEIGFIASIFNNGNNTVTEFNINYQAGNESNTINWNGNLSPGNSIDVNLTALSLPAGTYNVVAEVIENSDQIFGNNLFSIPVNINSPGIADVIQDFESDASQLLVFDFNDSSAQCANTNTIVWEKGQPTGAVLNEAFSGTNVYGTNLDGDYPNNALEYLVTQCYDLTAINNPFISFQMAFEIQNNWDVFYMEYSTDNGENWTLLGTAEDDNWYNSNAIQAGNCPNCVGAQWTGVNTEFLEYSLSLESFNAEPNVMFRFVLHTNNSIRREGVVIDDLRIGEGVLSLNDFSNQDFEIFPNPSKDVFNIRWNNGDRYDVSVFDITGKKIINIPITPQAGNSFQLDMTSFATGIYILQATSELKQIVKKIILQ